MSSIPYVLNIITGLSVGITTIIVNTGIVVLQIVLLRRRFHPFQLFQVAVCTVFGPHRLCAVLRGRGRADRILAAMAVRLLGIVLVATGVSFEVTANVITLAGEGLTLAMCTLLPRVKFGYMKVMCDCAMVIVAVALAFIFLHELAAVREGTLAAAIFVGLISKQFNKVITPARQPSVLPARPRRAKIVTDGGKTLKTREVCGIIYRKEGYHEQSRTTLLRPCIRV